MYYEYNPTSEFKGRLHDKTNGVEIVSPENYEPLITQSKKDSFRNLIVMVLGGYLISKLLR